MNSDKLDSSTYVALSNIPYTNPLNPNFDGTAEDYSDAGDNEVSNENIWDLLREITSKQNEDIWDLLQEITSKQNWYTKVFKEDIVSKWREDVPVCSRDNFELAVKLLQASAQGQVRRIEDCQIQLENGHVYHSKSCGWDDSNDICKDCSETLKQEIINNPSGFGLTPDELVDFFNEGWEIDFYDCGWDNSNDICKDCSETLKQEIINNPSGFGLTPDELVDFFNEGWEIDFYDWGRDNCNHPRCKCTPPHSWVGDYIEYHPQGVFDPELHAECKEVLSEMAEHEPIDWHPGSNEQVRDIIHPSMYCYVKGVSVDNDKTVAPECEENVRYQWLPSEFIIENTGKTNVTSYINNLDSNKYPRVVPLIEKVFEKFVPSLEQVLHRQLKGYPLQVIVKVASINLNLTKPNYPGGSWHIEGMPYEHIAATCILYVDVDNITDSFLEFRKPTIINEKNVDYPQSDDRYTTHHYGIEPGSHHNGVMNRYLGLISCHEGASVVFPNTLQHRVKDFSLSEGATSSSRMILAFLIIDPDNRIISTADIPPQQDLFTLEQAQLHRERLMIHRKYFVNQLNQAVFERPFSLC